MKFFLKNKSAFLRHILFFAWVIPRKILRTGANWLGAYSKPNKKLKKIEDLKNGDIVLTRIRIPSPWGYWNHCGLVVDQEKLSIAHSVIGSGVKLSEMESLYCCMELAVVRPKFIKQHHAERISKNIKNYLHKPFTFSYKRAMVGQPSAFSCSGLVWQIFFDVTGTKIPAPGF